MLRIENLSTGILKNICLSVKQGESVAIIGSSGSGKTTLLNAIAGYIPYQGRVFIYQKNVNTLPAWKRQCRYLNQRLYLFPYKTVGGNLALAQLSHPDRQRQLLLLTHLKIAHLIDRYPQQISGGEQQRAALARTLISETKLLLLDEPFSSLDWDTRIGIWEIINKLRMELGLTILFVTHEPKEAEYLADRAILLDQGCIIS